MAYKKIWIGSMGPFLVDESFDVAGQVVTSDDLPATDHLVPKTRKINGKALSSDIVLTPSDLGISGGFTGTVPLAKLSPGGTQGLLTIVAGRIVTTIDPT